MKVETILITGVTGFLGSNLAVKMIQKGYKIIALKRKSSSLKRIEAICSDIKLYDLDGLDIDRVFRENTRIDAIIHTATCYGRNNEPPMEIFESNTVFPLRLLDSAIKAGIRVFINTDTILDKYLNLYSLSKNHLLEWGKFYSMRHQIQFINMRLEHFYGPFDDDSKFTAFVINTCIKNLNSLKLTLGEQKRDFIYIDDVVSAYLTVLNSSNNSEMYFFEYDVGSGKSVTIREFVEKVHAITGSSINLEFGVVPYREGEIMASSADISSLMTLGWKCRYKLDEGIRLTIQNQIK